MELCQDNNTVCDTGTPLPNIDETATNVQFLGHTINDVTIFPTYILVILVPLQLFSHLMTKDKKKGGSFGKLGLVSITLTLFLAFLLSWKMSLDDSTERVTLQSPNQPLSVRNQIATYIFVVVLTLLEKTRLSTMTTTLLLFWTSSLVTVLISCYRGVSGEITENSDTIFYIDFTHIFVVILQCLLISMKAGDDERDKEKPSDVWVHPHEKASWLSQFTLFWTTDIIKIGAKRDLLESDVCGLAPVDQCRITSAKLERNIRIAEMVKKLNNEQRCQELDEDETKPDEVKLIEKQQSEPARISMLSVLIKTFGYKYFALQVVKGVTELTSFINPIMMTVFMNHIENRENEHWTKGIAIVFGISAVETWVHIYKHQNWVTILRFARQMRASLVFVVFKKALSVKNEANKDMTTGEIVNIISDDCERVMNLSQELFHLIATPLTAGIAMYLLYNRVGCAMLVGLVMMIMLIPLNRYVGKKIKALHKEREEHRDKRTKLMNEIINGIKVLKLYAWELSFMQKVQDIRNEEQKCSNMLSLFHACIDSMFRAIPFLVKLGSFGVYLYLGGRLDPTTGFITMHLFHILNHPFGLMPLLIPRYVHAAASLKRIEKFMNGEDIPTDNVLNKMKAKSAVSITEGDFTWERNRETNTLKNINVNIPKGSLVAVVGMVGTGKSSFLSAMLGEMEKVKGVVEVDGKIAYVPQEAWILNAPLKENVLFGSKMDAARYRRVVNACALKDDIDMMSAGDKTEIGEKGINLSGGQKQRVSLARALYNHADIFLFDDPLSAVDAHVGKHIFNKVISDKGLLQGKTRVLVTHGLHWLPRVDSIIVMKDGEISESGTYDELLTHDGAFAQFLRNAVEHPSENTNSKACKAVKRTLSRLDSMASNGGEFVEEEPNDNESSSESSTTENESNESGTDEQDGKNGVEDVCTKDDEKKGALIDDEDLEQGQVDKKVYFEYIKSIGYSTVVACFFIYIITAIFDSYNSFSMKQWTDDPFLANESLSDTDEYNERKWNHFYMFAFTGAIEVIGAFMYVILILRGTFLASTRLHNNLVYKILRCPMSFFDTTPSCRILTRFSKDVTRVDDFGGCLRGLITCFVNMLTFLAMIVYLCPKICLYLVPITIAYYVLFKFHIGSIRQLRRFRSKYRSPMYTHFTETLNGLSSIRAYGSQNQFIKNMEKHLDEFNKFDLMEIWSSLGLGIRSGLLYHLIVLIVGLVCVMDTSMTAGMVGLIIMYASHFTGTMNGFFWTITHAETEIISVERVIQYSNKPSEAEWDIPETKPALDWPSEGAVSFNGYKSRYREGLDLVLKGVDCQIQSGEKVGIVGRTGAGKTSLTMSFFRLLEAADGDIRVDGQNVADLGLHNLRSRINILPQEPVIFSGTLKMNLDPFGKHTDEELWIALKRSHLEIFVNTLPSKLEFECGEGGKNLSVGQRQLLCLARTLLRKTKILVLDEATAAVDMETDELIQKTIRTEFAECTVLTIAHRLNTILDYDKIMVLEFGTVKEFDSPKNLLANQDSTFYSMAKDAKLVKS